MSEKSIRPCQINLWVDGYIPKCRLANLMQETKLITSVFILSFNELL